MENDNAVLVASFSNSTWQEMNEMQTITSKRAEIMRGADGNGVVISCSLKRKRPPKIEIPNVLQEISADIFEGQGQGDGAVCFADSGAGVGVFSLKGKNKFMEDAHKIFSSSNGDKGFFGVYDGHGGSKAAEFVAENLHLKILEIMENSSENKAKEEAVKEGYLKTDEEFLKQGLSSGVCCVTALFEGREMVVSNLGDCRAVLCRNGIAEALTTDHKPAQEDERRRIEDKGGYVEIHRGTWRVHGTLSVSRSIGDAHLKDWVMAEPDTKVICLSLDMEYLVLASDGLWKEVSDQEAIDIVMQSRSVGKKQPPLLKSNKIFHPTGGQCCDDRSPPSKSQRISVEKVEMKIKNHFPNNENQFLVEKSTNNGGLVAVCRELVNLAARRGSLDDITVMVVDLNHYKGLI